MNAPRRAVLIAAVVLVTALAGCATPPDAATTAPPTADTTGSPPPLPAAGNDALTGATGAATAMMTEYLNTTRTEAAWWQAVSPYLSPQAAYLIEGTSPTKIPTATISTTRALDGATDVTVRVAVDTTRGTYTLTMRRIGDDGNTLNAAWRVDDITFPATAR